MRNPVLAAPAALLVATLLGCSSEIVLNTPDRPLLEIKDKVIPAQDPALIWDMLPPSYRRKLQDHLPRLTAAIPGKVHEKAFQVVQQLGIVLKSKSEEIYELSALPRQLSTLSFSEDKFFDLLTHIGNVLILLGGSEIGKPSKVATLDLRSFLATTGHRMWLHGARALAVMGQDLEEHTRDLKHEVQQLDDGTATLTLDLPILRKPIPMRRVEGRWIPQALVDAWPKLEQAMTTWEKNLVTPSFTNRGRELEKVLDQVLVDLALLRDTEGRTKFNNAAQKILTSWAQNPLLQDLIPSGMIPGRSKPGARSSKKSKRPR